MKKIAISAIVAFLVTGTAVAQKQTVPLNERCQGTVLGWGVQVGYYPKSKAIVANTKNMTLWCRRIHPMADNHCLFSHVYQLTYQLAGNAWKNVPTIGDHSHLLACEVSKTLSETKVLVSNGAAYSGKKIRLSSMVYPDGLPPSMTTTPVSKDSPPRRIVFSSESTEMTLP